MRFFGDDPFLILYLLWEAVIGWVIGLVIVFCWALYADPHIPMNQLVYKYYWSLAWYTFGWTLGRGLRYKA